MFLEQIEKDSILILIQSVDIDESYYDKKEGMVGVPWGWSTNQNTLRV